MRVTKPTLILLLLPLCACVSRQTNSARLAEVKADVQSFTRAVAENVTREGPSAWGTYFETGPSFFMAVDGHVQFQDGASAQAAIPNLVRAIKKIELQWGDALRVDPLTQEFAVVAAPWHEIVTFANGNRVDSSGYFTAVAENRNGQWQFRDAHWSTAQPAGPAK